MANLNAQLAGANLQVIDNSISIQRVNSPIATVVGQVAAHFYDAYFSVANPGPTALTLPGTTVWIAVVRNISGSNTVSITATPAGGAAWGSPLVLAPNAVFIYMATFSSNPSSGGITTLSLGTNGAGTFAEIFLGA